jgi:hypothetical protein
MHRYGGSRAARRNHRTAVSYRPSSFPTASKSPSPGVNYQPDGARGPLRGGVDARGVVQVFVHLDVAVIVAIDHGDGGALADLPSVECRIHPGDRGRGRQCRHRRDGGRAPSPSSGEDARMAPAREAVPDRSSDALRGGMKARESEGRLDSRISITDRSAEQDRTP